MTILSFFFLATSSFSADNLLEKQIGFGTDSDELGYAYGETGDVNDTKDIRLFVADLINIFLGFLGIIFLTLIIYGGFLWMNAGGNDAQVAKAKSILITGVIGLIVILASYSISAFVIEKVYNATLHTS